MGRILWLRPASKMFIYGCLNEQLGRDWDGAVPVIGLLDMVKEGAYIKELIITLELFSL